MFNDKVEKKYALAMAIERKKWIDRVDNFLRGAFGEFIKEKLAKEVGIAFSWQEEITGLLDEIVWLMDEKNIKRTFQDTGPAFIDAYEDSISGLRLKINESAGIFFDRYLPENKLESKRDAVKKWVRDHGSQKAELLYEMLETYKPELIKLLEGTAMTC